ncbi:hypothetical protein [Dyella japonica]|uniref:Uncharacterized protein n=1 Tax=Dyella japonica A8 TaxID=1217721 RepID=A0A075K0F6_9GAMM|nr:hypothetical protein [Dyella japonica]AIF47806.1 hypothetical protein HY57_11280 [Dyella japonica A8]
MFPSGRPFVLVGMGFVAGLAVSAGIVTAAVAPPVIVPSGHAYTVSIDEVRQNFVWSETIEGAYKRVVTTSDGTVHEITLRPVNKDGRELVELTDQSRDGLQHSYMGPNGTTTDGSLMVNVKDLAELQALMKTGASTAR